MHRIIKEQTISLFLWDVNRPEIKNYDIKADIPNLTLFSNNINLSFYDES